MKAYLFLLYFFSLPIVAQEKIQTVFIQKDSLDTDTFISKNTFGDYYYIKDNALIKKSDNNLTSYSNIQLGKITTVNTFNPLKTNLFYKDLNTVIILDNRVTEITKTDFNTLQPYRNISHITTGFDNTIWVFNQDYQYLELYDYKTQTTRLKTIPINSKVIDITSNYNLCWLLTEKHLYCYNYFGSLVYKFENNGYTSIKSVNKNLVIQKQNSLLFFDQKNKSLTPIELPNLLIKQFHVTNQILYIYSNKSVHQYQLKTN